MTILILGLVVFLGVHCARIFAEDARLRFIAQRGHQTWKALYSVASVLGFAMIIYGFYLASQKPVVIWHPPVAARHLAALLTLIAFILVAAAYVPSNQIKARLHHPMVLGIAIWALAHLLANGFLADVILFASFLFWAVASFLAARRRDRIEASQYPTGKTSATIITLVAGGLAWGLFAFWLHGLLIGVRPIG